MVYYLYLTKRKPMKKHLSLVLMTMLAGIALAQPSREIPRSNPGSGSSSGSSSGSTGGVRERQNTPRSNENNSGGGSGRGQERPPAPVYVPVYTPPAVIYQGSGIPFDPNPAPAVDPAVRQRMMISAGRDYVKEMLSNMKPEVQVLKIKDAAAGGTVTGEKGFEVEFPPMAFVDADGYPVLGEVDVTLTEYNDFADFAAEGLTTQTTDGQIIETGGMINISASSGGRALQLAQGREITIRVPDLNDRNGFRTFYGVRGDNWQWSTDPQQATDNADKEVPTDFTFRMMPVRFAKGGRPAEMGIWKNAQPLHEYVNSRLQVKPAVREKLLKAGIPFRYSIKINAMGQITEVTPMNRQKGQKTLISPMDAQIETILKEAPALDVSELPTEVTKTYEIMFMTVGARNGVPLAIRPPAPEMPATNENVNRDPNAANVGNFAMTASTMGMINCDRFTGNRSTDTLHYSFERADAMVYIMIKDMRSMIQPSGSAGEYRMTGIPAGRQLRSVAVVYDDEGGVNIKVADHESGNKKVEFTQTMPFSAENLRMVMRP